MGKKPSPGGRCPAGADEGNAKGLWAVAWESSSHRLAAMPAPFDKGAYWCGTAAPLVKGGRAAKRRGDSVETARPSRPFPSSVTGFARATFPREEGIGRDTYFLGTSTLVPPM